MMAIDPTGAGGTPAFDAARAASQNASVRAAAERGGDAEAVRKTTTAAAGDLVQLSAESRGLVQRAAAPAPVEEGAAVGLSAEKLKSVLERIENGFYDRAEVRDSIARGIARDMGTE